MTLRDYGRAAHGCPNIQECLISSNVQNLGARPFLYKYDVEIMMLDEICQHPYSCVCRYAVGVDCGYAYDVHFLRRV